MTDAKRSERESALAEVVTEVMRRVQALVEHLD